MRTMIAVMLMAVGCGDASLGVVNARSDMAKPLPDMSGPCLVGLPCGTDHACAAEDGQCGGLEIGICVPVQSDAGCGSIGEPCCFNSRLHDAGYCNDNFAYHCVYNMVNGARVCGRCP